MPVSRHRLDPRLGRRGRPAATALLGSVLVSSLVAACSADSDVDPVSATATETSAPTASRTPAFPDDTRRQTGRPSGRLLVLTDVRVVERDGFDRTVLEFAGRGLPGWVVDYVDEAVLDGSGRVVRLDGDAVLDVYASATTAPAPRYYDGPRRLRAGDGAVTEVYVAGTFEGTTQVLLGIDGERAPFRVLARSHPARLVVDVEEQAGD